MEEWPCPGSSSRAEQDIFGSFGASHGARCAAADQKCSWEKAGGTAYEEELFRLDWQQGGWEPIKGWGIPRDEEPKPECAGNGSPVPPECVGVRSQQGSRRK